MTEDDQVGSVVLLCVPFGIDSVNPTEPPKTFHLILIKPSHYDDEGYVIQWVRSSIPSNTMAAIYGLALDCAERKVLGDDVQLSITALDETNTRIKPRELARMVHDAGGHGLIAMVGVQTNQFPRAMDLAREFHRSKLSVCIGGFHVSGCLAMLPTLPSDLQQAMDEGMSLFAGEVEGHLDRLLRDAYSGQLQLLYNVMKDPPGLEGQPVPYLPAHLVHRMSGARTSFDTRIKPRELARMVHDAGGHGLIAMVGVQTNQFPRAMDLAREFHRSKLSVCIGGFHVSGCLAMLPTLPSDLQQAMDEGMSLFAGEVEGHLDRLLRDAYSGQLQLLYNVMKDPPGLEGQPVPYLPAHLVHRMSGARTSFDAGRGCPFLCSFCTIINVQGRKSRFRSPDDIEQLVRTNVAQGIHKFFVTDDNFARNQAWEGMLDRLIQLREEEGIQFKITIQVDTMCHKIPRFIEKAGRAGVVGYLLVLKVLTRSPWRDPENIKTKSQSIGACSKPGTRWAR